MSSWPNDPTRLPMTVILENVVLGEMGFIDAEEPAVKHSLDLWRANPNSRKLRRHFAAHVFGRLAMESVSAAQKNQSGALAELGNEILNFISGGPAGDLEKQALTLMTRAAEQRLKVTGPGNGPEEDENRYFMSALEDWIHSDPEQRLKYLRARISAAAPALPGDSPAKPPAAAPSAVAPPRSFAEKPRNAPPPPDPTRGIPPVLQIPLDPEPESAPPIAPDTPSPALEPIPLQDEALKPPAPLEVDPDLRRLPVYLLLDCSGSMAGDPIESMRAGVRSLTSDLKSDPQALESAWLSVIAFGQAARQLTPLTDLMTFQEPHLEAKGITSLGAALTLLDECITREVRTPDATQKGDWMPLVFIMTDGLPTDAWEAPAKHLIDNNRAAIVACAAGSNADAQLLRQISPHVVELQTLQPDALKAFFKWASAAVKSVAAAPQPQGEPVYDNALPPPPPNITIVP